MKNGESKRLLFVLMLQRGRNNVYTLYRMGQKFENSRISYKIFQTKVIKLKKKHLIVI